LANLVVAAVAEWPFLGLTYLLLERDKLDLAAPSEFNPTSVIVALAATSWGLPAILYGVLTAPILKGRLPAFKKRNWIGLHIVVGLVLSAAAAAIVAGYLGIGTAGQRLHWWVNWLLDTEVLSYATADELSFRKLFLIGGVPIIAPPLVAAIAGAIIGSIQALVLRNAARELVVWSGLSALAAASGSIVGTLRPLERFFELSKVIDPESARNGYAPIDAYHNLLDLFFTTIGSALLLLPSIVSASIMLVAVRRLRPR
jgi:hypothetical protein